MPRTPPPTTPSRPSLAARLRSWFGASSAAAGPASDPDAPATATPSWPSVGAQPDRPLPRLDDYVLEHVIARSERSTIYRATGRADQRLIALKMVHLGQATADDRGLARERFLRESAAAARLKHENIVRVYAGGVTGADTGLKGWLAMEWVHGTDLTQYAGPGRLLPERLVLSIAARIALALDFAHRSGVVHRDIKPGNVLFDPNSGAVKVTDFGSARISDTVATRSGVMLGTPAYMAPEQLAGAIATAQCDLYALGVLLFELLVGRRPFESDSMGDLLSRIARQAPPPLRALRPELPQLLEDIVARLLSKRPDERHASGRRLAIELRMAQAQCAAAPTDEPAWADTEPIDRLEDAEPVRRGARTPGEPVPHKGVRGAPGPAAIQGTIDGADPSAQRSLRRTLPSS